jgi:bifunctional non-homologous end joining protein LigD
VRPEMVCEVRFTAWTGGHLRHPIFLGMREDKPARTVRREMPCEETATRSRASNSQALEHSTSAAHDFALAN